MAKKVPGKEEFEGSIQYYKTMLEKYSVEIKLMTRVDAEDLIRMEYDEIILATGVSPRIPRIPGIGNPKVLLYTDVLKKGKSVGNKVAIIGAGGIGFDVAEFLLQNPDKVSAGLDKDIYFKKWGVDTSQKRPGGLTQEIEEEGPFREIFLCQRKKSKLGSGLGKTTGWAHRLSLKKDGVKMLSGVSYKEINDEGLVIEHQGEEKILKVDNVIICSGQVSKRDLYSALKDSGMSVHLIGGAYEAKELDAKSAIKQGSELAFEI